MTLQWLEYYAIEMNSEGEEDIDGRWDIRVTDGAPVNVCFMLDAMLTRFEDPLINELEYWDEFSMLNTTSFSMSIDLPGDEPSHLVIECAGFSAIDTSTVEYDVEWTEDREDWYHMCIPGFIAGGAVVVVIIYAWWRMRGGGSADGEPPDATPPPGMG